MRALHCSSSNAGRPGETIQITFSNQAVLMPAFSQGVLVDISISLRCPPHPHLPISLSRPRHLRYSYLHPSPQSHNSPHFGARFQTHGFACLLSKPKLLGLNSQWRTLARRGFKRFHMCPQIQALFRGRDTGLFTGGASSWNRARKCDK